jgi:hypothetical protein
MAGSTRPPDLRLPFGYALAWELMQWGRESGATWFDFGGTVTGTRHIERSGIDAFKRMFGTDVVEVSHPWTLVPRPFRAAWVEAVSRVIRGLQSLALPGRGHRSRGPRTSLAIEVRAS